MFNKKNEDSPESLYRKHGDYTLWILIAFVLVVIFASITIYNNSIKGKCNSFENDAIDAAFKFAVNNDILPSYEGTSQTINLDAVDFDKNFRNSTCSGTVTIIKTNNGYVKELNLTNCNKCTTDKKKFGKATEEFKDNKTLVKVNVTYNYQNRQVNYSPWTEWYDSSLISPNENEYGVNMPYDEENYPTIPDGGTVISYEYEKKNFYSYRDKTWKFYKNANNEYSTFSSTKPTNYAYKDTKTEIKKEQSEWSINYPEEKEYREIKTATGYKYYYEDEDKTKIYYNGGNYTVKIEDKTLEKLYNKKEKETVKMYSYIDTMWKWYNGSPREYSSYMKESTSSYPYKDTDLVKYSDWSQFKETSSLNNANANYREEKTDTHSRFRAKYSFDSAEILSEYMSLQDFEKATGRSIADMQDDENINLLIKYTYQYGK